MIRGGRQRHGSWIVGHAVCEPTRSLPVVWNFFPISFNSSFQDMLMVLFNNENANNFLVARQGQSHPPRHQHTCTVGRQQRRG